MRALASWSIGCVLALIATGCGGGGGGGATPGGGALTTAQRNAAMADVSAYFKTLPANDPTVTSPKLVSYIKSKPEFAGAFVAPDFCVTAFFKDGIVWVLPNNDPDAGQPKVAHIAMPATPTTRGLPGTKEAVLMNGFGPDRTNINSQIAAMLNAAGGYTMRTVAPTLEGFRSVQGNTALLFTNLHGGKYAYPKENPVFHQFIVTSTPLAKDWDRPTNPNYQDIFNARLVVAGEAPNQTYGIGPDWLKNMSFGPNSIWINNACRAYDQEFYTAAFNSKLSAYVAWDDSVHWLYANNAALFLVDRLAGANLDNHFEIPPQRPFDLASAMISLAKREGVNSITNATMNHSIWIDTHDKRIAHATCRYALNPLANSDHFESFAPSILNMETVQIADNLQELQIYGRFGKDPGTVTIGGSNVTVANWAPDKIRCNLPAHDAAGASGNVVATVNGHKSNACPLTMWKVDLKQTVVHSFSGTMNLTPPLHADVSGSVTTNATLTIWIRGDIHRGRIIEGTLADYATSGTSAPRT